MSTLENVPRDNRAFSFAVRELWRKKQSIFFNNYLNFPLSSDKIIPPNFATTSGENISDT